ncbi:uncharacterized protein LACBIDRAFT_319104 [Laccaria bicolor S238N-H82]|uniref:Predicted protein n=1 Tax=Laccaria bicolor (strain S238N-H82 / ATCC MYA-4686) TaxID=486041 RepID=B0D7W1_LACBS|nr:uncharacterized protein LACBIDRAFT_319104 [Laccaria bicolor S238N-H82]EDR09713.1 predicted protein [Laccaria bicolor S238N-H82]|eukprot:XP_001880062.1 predicted protein [Laccaria bicolor S238N-H82]
MADDDLASAIALSLQESNLNTRAPIMVESGEEDDQELQFQADLKRALEASKSELSREARSQSNSESSTNLSRVTADVGGSTSSNAFTFLADRAQMEKERQERQRRLFKQQGKMTAHREEDNNDSDVEEPCAKRPRLTASHSINSSGRNSRASPSSTSGTDSIFWNGEFRQTATRHADPRKDNMATFRLTEVLGQKKDIAFAILSSYSLDWMWIYQFFDPATPVIMVAQPDQTGRAIIKNVLPHWIKTTPYLRGGHGCQHMKFMLLFYRNGRLRVVVSTANLIEYDWRDMENSVWLQDVPLRSSPIPHDPKATNDFPSIIQRVLNSLNVKPHPNLALKSIEDLRCRWDWSKVKVHLVPSIAGKHEGWPAVIKTGHPRLMMAVREMAMRTGKGKAKELILECQGSSLGIYTTQWMNEFHWSARGESAEDWLDEPKKRREKLPYPPIKIFFPSKRTVQESALGEKGGGTIFCRRKQWSTKNFPRDHFYDSKSKGGPVLMHSKMIIATHQETTRKTLQAAESSSEEDDDIEVVDPPLGWSYLGSHNFTPSAWGNLSGSSFNPVLNIANYELGIVFPVKDAAEADKVACWQRPPRKYTTKDEPWMQEESVYHQS